MRSVEFSWAGGGIEKRTDVPVEKKRWVQPGLAGFRWVGFAVQSLKSKVQSPRPIWLESTTLALFRQLPGKVRRKK